MRTIKFRGKDEQGEWNYGNFVQYKEDDDEEVCCIVSTARSEISAELVFVPVNKETVGQYTGLCDKNGKEIYEGDILRNQFSKLPFGVVEWNNKGGYYFINTDFYHIFSIDNYKPLGEALVMVIHHKDENKRVYFEVIGNIYDSNEFLKGNITNIK